MDYIRLFSREYDYKTVSSSVNSFIKDVRRELPELDGKGNVINLAQIQIDGLKKFENQYKEKEFLGMSKGFKNANGKVEMVVITSEHIEYAKKYLRLEDEYICYTTMNKVLMQLIKGEIKVQDIDNRANKRSAVLKLEEKEQIIQELKQKEEQTQKEMKVAKLIKEEYEEKLEKKEGNIR